MKAPNWKKHAFALTESLGLSLNARRLLYNNYVYLENFLKYGDPFFCRIICIEINTYCNRRCYYCPVSLENQVPDLYMDEEIFKTIIARIKEIGFTGSIMYHFYNEPLYDKRIVDFVAHTQSQLPQCLSRIFTSGDYLTPELADQLFEAGVNDFVVTDHNKTPGKVQKRLMPIIKKYPHRISVDIIHDEPLVNRGGALDADQLGFKLEIKENCTVVYEEMKIDFEGNVLLCTSDYYRTQKFGNLKDKGIMEIWNDPVYSRLRTNLRLGKPELEICKNCNFATPPDSINEKPVEKIAQAS